MKRLLYCLSFFLLLGCRRVADFDFDTQTQSLTINDGYFYDICFENDSVTSDGKLYAAPQKVDTERWKTDGK